jgi:hypothetical protein
MRDFDHDRMRAAGPAVVWHGDGPESVLVLDPAGEARHDELPGTWRPLSEHVRVGWYRLPAGHEPPSFGASPVHLVAAGTAALPALDLAEEHHDVVRSVIVFDPAPTHQEADTEWWDDETELQRRRLIAHDVQVRCFVSRYDDPTVRTRRPVPLGHPHVVGRLTQLLVAEGRQDTVADAWGEVQEHVRTAMNRARRGG